MIGVSFAVGSGGAAGLRPFCVGVVYTGPAFLTPLRSGSAELHCDFKQLDVWHNRHRAIPSRHFRVSAAVDADRLSSKSLGELKAFIAINPQSQPAYVRYAEARDRLITDADKRDRATVLLIPLRITAIPEENIVSLSIVEASAPGSKPGYRAEPTTVSLIDAPAFTGLSRSSLYRLAAAGDIALIKVGRCTLLCVASWKRYLSRQPHAVIRGDRPRAAA